MGRNAKLTRAHNGNVDVLGKLHRELITLYDELADSAALTAFVCDGTSGIIDGDSTVDPATQKGLCIAAGDLKRRNHAHVARLKALCDNLRTLRAPKER